MSEAPPPDDGAAADAGDPRGPVQASALILAGGASRRLGRDKAWEEVGGAPVIARLLEATRAFRDTVISVREVAPFERRLAAHGIPEPGRRLRLVADASPDRGPVAGLAAGLGAARLDPVLVLACDLPFVTGALCRALVERAAAGDADAVVPSVDGRRQPLCAAYRRRVGREAAALLAEPAGRNPSVRDLLARLEVATIDASDVGPLLADIDTPDDLARARARAASEAEGDPQVP